MTAFGLIESIAELTRLAAVLNAATDRAGTIFRATETMLNDIGVGLEVRLAIETSDADAEPLTLCYARMGSKFRVVISAGNKFVPWDQARRERKLRAVVYVPQLIHLLARRATELAAITEDVGGDWFGAVEAHATTGILARLAEIGEQVTHK